MTPHPHRVLVTGATGLLGRYLLFDLCADGRFAVTANYRKGSDRSGLEDLPNLTWRLGDLEDQTFVNDLLDDADAVVHAAGLVSYRDSDAAALRRYNVELTARLADAALALNVGHFLHVSSVAAISPAQSENTVDERALTFHPHDYSSSYARAKYYAELEVWRAGEEGLPFTILNPSVILGAGDWRRSSAQLFDWVAQGQRYYPAGGTGYVDARDVAAFAKTCLLGGPAQRRFIVSAHNWSFGRFFKTVAQALGVNAPQTLAGPWFAELAWRGAGLSAKLQGRDPLLTKETARRAQQTLTYDNAASLAAGATYRPLEQTIWDVARAYATQAQTEAVTPE